MENNNLKDFVEHIKKGFINIIETEKLILNDYPYGFKKCIMTFEKVNNRNGQIIKRTSEFNGKISQPKTTTATDINFFVFDKELQRHFIVDYRNEIYTLFTTNFFNANGIYKEYYFSEVSEKYLGNEYNDKKQADYLILADFFKDSIKKECERLGYIKKVI